MILHTPFSSTNHKAELSKSNIVQLLKNKLNNRLNQVLRPFDAVAKIGNISLGCSLVAGYNRVPNPAAGITTLRIILVFSLVLFFCGNPYILSLKAKDELSCLYRNQNATIGSLIEWLTAFFAIFHCSSVLCATITTEQEFRIQLLRC